MTGEGMPDRSRQRAAYVAGSLSGFVRGNGLEGAPLSPQLIEAYCHKGLVGRTSSTVGTYRSVLRAVGDVPRHPARPFSGAPAPAPYSVIERRDLVAMAMAQPRRWMSRSAIAAICLGIGAGVRAGELVDLVGDDVRVVADVLVVSVHGRVVRVREPYQAVVADEAARAGADHLFRPGAARRSYKNFVNDLCRKLVADPACPALSLLRCRSSFICDHLQQATPLEELIRQAGIESVCSLRRHAVHVQGVPRTNAGLLRRSVLESAER